MHVLHAAGAKELHWATEVGITVFCIIVSAWTYMIMEFKLVDGVQFLLVLSSVLCDLPPL